MYQQATFYGVLFIAYLFIFQPNLSDIPSWYMASPTLEQSGLQIVGQLIVKTFFVALRVIPPLFMLLCSIYYLTIGTKAKNYLMKES